MSTIALTQKWTLDGTFTGPAGAVDTPILNVTVGESQSWNNGTSVDQANQYFQKSGTASGSAVTIDIEDGSEVDDFGTVIACVRVKMLAIVATTKTNNFDLSITGTFIQNPVLLGTTPSFELEAGGIWIVTSPRAGYGVTATSGSTIILDPSSNNVGYRLYLLAEV